MDHKNEAGLSYTVPGLSVAVTTCFFLFSCQLSYVYDRHLCFQVRSVSIEGLSGGGVLVLNQDGTACFPRR